MDSALPAIYSEAFRVFGKTPANAETGFPTAADVAATRLPWRA
ncbi:MAG TPA: hypothetical protein PLB25_14600 [Rhodoferax sp.]|nr:hypothetical protein [Rhodoferax sp.]